MLELRTKQFLIALLIAALNVVVILLIAFLNVNV